MKRIAVLPLILLGLIFTFANLPAQAQEDCGSGLIQRMTVDGQGFVLDEIFLRVRNEPGGDRVNELDPGTTFSVIGGPECFDDITWWQIEADDFVIGWVAEGLDGEYFIAPLENVVPSGGGSAGGNPYALINENPDCSDAPPSRIQLGQLVSGVDEDDHPGFYGHPLVALFQYSYDWFYGEDTIAVEGPYCFNGNYLWKIAYPSYTSFYDHTSPLVGSRGLVDGASSWIYEALEGEYLLEPNTEQIEIIAPYTPNRMTLFEPEAPPLISPELQIAYSFAGGGGSGPEHWYVGCDQGAMDYYGNGCLYLYPFPLNSTVTVTIRQPDGSIFSTQTQTTHNINAIAEVLADVENFEIEYVDYVFGGVRVELPHNAGLQQGVWTVEAVGAGLTLRRAYNLAAYATNAALISRCDGPSPLLQMTNFEPQSSLELVLVEVASYDGTLNEAALTSYTFTERYRWSLNTDAQGEAIAYIGQPFGTGYFVIADENGAWQTNLPDTSDNGSVGLLAKEAQWACPRFTNSEIAMRYPLEYGQLISSRFALSVGYEDEADAVTELYYTFEGRAGDIVDLEMVSFTLDDFYIDPDDFVPLDPKLRLETPDGTVLAENDNADDPQHGELDSEIRDLILPEDGIYTIVASANNPEISVGFMLILNGESENLANDGGALVIDNAFEGTLEGEYVELMFTGEAGDTVTIDANSSDFDARLQLRDVNGSVLAEDDDSGEGLNAQIAEFTLPTTGTYTVRVFTWVEKTGNFILSITSD